MGRVMLPAPMRAALDLNTGALVNLTIKGEAWLTIDPTEEGDILFVFSVRTSHGDIEKVKDSPVFKSLLAGIRKR